MLADLARQDFKLCSRQRLLVSSNRIGHGLGFAFQILRVLIDSCRVGFEALNMLADLFDERGMGCLARAAKSADAQLIEKLRCQARPEIGIRIMPCIELNLDDVVDEW